jgi:hypothetical protein
MDNAEKLTRRRRKTKLKHNATQYVLDTTIAIITNQDVSLF